MFARFAFAFVAELGAGVRAVGSSFSATDLSTRMGLDISFVLGVFKLPAEAVVFGHDFVELEFALGTSPGEDDLVFVLVLVDVENPSLDAFQVHRNVATRTGPNVVSFPDRL